MKLIQTPHIFSSIQARDAILINTVLHINKKNHLILKGTVYSELVKDSKCETITPFEICFMNVKKFDCVSLDFSKLDSKMSSNFMILENSEFIINNKLQKHCHYLFSTYSYVYQIVAQEYTFSLG